MNQVVEQMLQRVPEGGMAEGNQALREVMQEIALAGLYRRGFFGKAAFYGGTCLRIFQQLPRFSEDLDFSLLQSDPEFSLDRSAGCGGGVCRPGNRRGDQGEEQLHDHHRSAGR